MLEQMTLRQGLRATSKPNSKPYANAIELQYCYICYHFYYHLHIFLPCADP